MTCPGIVDIRQSAPTGPSQPGTEDPKVLWVKFQIAPRGLVLWANLFSNSSRWQKFWNFVRRAQSRDGPGPVLRIQRSYGRNFKSLLEDWFFEQICSADQADDKNFEILSVGPSPGTVPRIQRSYGRNFKSLLEDWCFEQIFSVIQVHRWLKFETYPQMCHLSQKKLIKLTKNSKWRMYFR